MRIVIAILRVIGIIAIIGFIIAFAEDATTQTLHNFSWVALISFLAILIILGVKRYIIDYIKTNEEQ